MKWNNVLKIKTLPKNIDKNCNCVVEYLENRYKDNLIKELSDIGGFNGESKYLIRTYRKILKTDLESAIKEIIGKEFVALEVSANTFFED